MIPDSLKLPTVRALAESLVCRAPQHAKSLSRRFAHCSDDEACLLEDIADKIVAIAGGNMPTVLDDYVWLCGVMLEEEMYFRRHGSYRYSTFREAFDNIYSDDAYMARYMNGLLLSQLWWSNHSDIIAFYRRKYLDRLTDGSRHLEIGPGHGLLLAYACDCSHVGGVVAWDISPVSIRHTAAALRGMEVRRQPSLEVVDLFNASAGQFDSIVFSEVLEHTENPRDALSAVVANLAPSGLLFLNMPINSPAPDHLFNLPAPEDVLALVIDSGLHVVDSRFAPITNSTLDRARRLDLTISCGIIAKKVV